MTETTKPAKPDTPELQRQSDVITSGRASEIQEFIDWLGTSGYTIARDCDPETCIQQQTGRYCGRCQNTGLAGPVSSFEQLMADYFEIDRDKIETERRALLAWLGEVNG